MNDEEAIERCNELIKESHSCWIGITNQVAIQTVLNLIEKQKADIEELKAMELKAKGGVIKVTLEGLLNLENEIKQRDKEIEKKDKIINEMEKYIDEITEKIANEKNIEDFEFCDDKCTDKDEYIECKQCIKEYFENKVKESK